MITIGLTGGIGAGKSTISKLFKKIGIPVFDSDKCARDAEQEISIQDAFKRILGDDILVDGVVDRVKMRGIIFVDKAKLQEINDVILPYIKMKFKQFVLEQRTPYVILESAILFEPGAIDGFDSIITVTADTNIRIDRALKRDKTTNLEEIQNKLNNQLPEEYKVNNSNHIIFNNGVDLLDSITMLSTQVYTIHKAILYDIVHTNLEELLDKLNHI